MTESSVGVELTKVADRTAAAATDVVAAEEPLEIRLDNASFVVIMRTPGADRELTAGFLLPKVSSATRTTSGRFATAPTPTPWIGTTSST